MSAHHVTDNLSAATEGNLMDDNVQCAEDPMLRVGPFNPNTGLIARDNGRLTKSVNTFGFAIHKPERFPTKKIANGTLTDRQTKNVCIHCLQALITEMVEMLVVERQRADHRAER